MRGAVLLLDHDDSRAACAQYFREDGLLVYEAARADDALKLLDRITPDVVVTAFGTDHGSFVIRELRSRVGHATSIIVVSSHEHRVDVRASGADSLLLEPVLHSEILYEIHRALILRRSGRRLPWNWSR